MGRKRDGNDNDDNEHWLRSSKQQQSKKKEESIGKNAAEKSGGLFNADDWMCKSCGNINWARRYVCNLCRAPKHQKVEKRTGVGGGFNEREGIEYKERVESDDEYDEFGRKKKKKYREANDDQLDHKNIIKDENDDDDDNDDDKFDATKYALDDEELLDARNESNSTHKKYDKRTRRDSLSKSNKRNDLDSHRSRSRSSSSSRRRYDRTKSFRNDKKKSRSRSRSRRRP